MTSQDVSLIQELVIYRRKNYVQERKNIFWYKHMIIFFLISIFWFSFLYPVLRDENFEAESESVMLLIEQKGKERLSQNDDKHISQVKFNLFISYMIKPLSIIFYALFVIKWHGEYANKEKKDALIKFPDIIDDTKNT